VGSSAWVVRGIGGECSEPVAGSAAQRSQSKTHTYNDNKVALHKCWNLYD
jgi:hypothetical protein